MGGDRRRDVESGQALARKRRAWEARFPWPCLRCGAPVELGQEWDLDHEQALAEGGSVHGRRVPSHRSCNRAHGARLVNARRNAARSSTGRRIGW